MKVSGFAILGASVLWLSSVAHVGDVRVEGAITAFGTAFNKGDLPAAKAVDGAVGDDGR